MEGEVVVDGDDDETEEGLEAPVVIAVAAPVPVPVAAAGALALALAVAVAAVAVAGGALPLRKNCRRETMDDGPALDVAGRTLWAALWAALVMVLLVVLLVVLVVVLGVLEVVVLLVVGVEAVVLLVVVGLEVVVVVGLVVGVEGVDRWARIALREGCWLRFLFGVKALPLVLVGVPVVELVVVPYVRVGRGDRTGGWVERVGLLSPVFCASPGPGPGASPCPGGFKEKRGSDGCDGCDCGDGFSDGCGDNG